MKKMKVIIIDDEQDAVASIELIIKEFCPGIELLGSANIIDDAWELIKKTEPDLVFLDINMPRGTGFDLLERFPIRKFDVIFITAYNKYEEKSAAYGAFAYLQKPIDIDLIVSTTKELINHRNAHPRAVFRIGI